jgi:hypothetical protein
MTRNSFVTPGTLARRREKEVRDLAAVLHCRLQRKGSTYILHDQLTEHTVFITSADLRAIERRLVEMLPEDDSEFFMKTT